MSSERCRLNQFGWNEWFDSRAAEFRSHELRIARVIAVDREQFVVVNETGEYRVKLSGRLLHTTAQSCDFPCVGDWVSVQQGETDATGLIQGVLPRTSFLRRKAAGNAVEYQMIAANIDVALIVQSCHYDFNLNRLERYLVMVRDGHVLPVIVLTKTDLVEPETLAQLLQGIRETGISLDVIALSSVTGEGLRALRERLLPRKTYCLLGSSGVGKSTLINQLTGSQLLDTRAVSGTGEGRHTTVRRELIMLDNGAMLIDNPGMREFGIVGGGEGMGDSFADIYDLVLHCRYKDCSHSNEPGCAVLKALDDGQLQEAYYQNFIKLRSEAEFHEMSYLEKRKKDKAFGRYVKSAKKDLRHG